VRLDRARRRLHRGAMPERRVRPDEAGARRHRRLRVRLPRLRRGTELSAVRVRLLRSADRHRPAPADAHLTVADARKRAWVPALCVKLAP
jgi:hypothetical protein